MSAAALILLIYLPLSLTEYLVFFALLPFHHDEAWQPRRYSHVSVCLWKFHDHALSKWHLITPTLGP